MKPNYNPITIQLQYPQTIYNYITIPRNHLQLYYNSVKPPLQYNYNTPKPFTIILQYHHMIHIVIKIIVIKG